MCDLGKDCVMNGVLCGVISDIVMDKEDYMIIKIDCEVSYMKFWVEGYKLFLILFLFFLFVV